MKRQAAVFVTVPADSLVGEFRQRHQPRAVARRLPPHITVIPPFVRDTSDDALVEALAEHFLAVQPFTASLARVGTFARHVWLAPEPNDAFMELLTRARDRFSELVRDDDRQPVPHLTIAEAGKGSSTRAIAELAEHEIVPRLPFSFEVRDVGLWEAQPEGWAELRRLPLG